MKKISLDEFLRGFKVTPPNKLGFFLGSGCSIQSGIPSGGQLAWEFKRSLYCTNQKINEERFKDLDLERNQKILQDYFDTKGGHPVLGDPKEYSFYFEKCFPQPQHRRMFLKQKMLNRKPSLGHLCLGSLLANGKANRVYTTNFDDLIEKGLAEVNSSLSFVTYSEDNKSFPNHENNNLPWVIKLHGDYLYDSLLNTEAELQSLEERFHNHIREFGMQNGLVFIGYSGSDDSIMNCLEDTVALDNPFPTGFYWTIRNGQTPSQRVIDLVNNLSAKSNLCGFVEIDHFDEFAYDLVSVCQYSNDKIEATFKASRRKIPFDLSPSNQASVAPIKLNAFQSLSLPTHYYRFKSSIQTWKELRELSNDQPVIAGLFKSNIFCFGEISDIKRVFDKKIESDITIQDIREENLERLNSVELGMIYELISRSMEKQYDLNCVSRRRRLFFSKKYRIPNTEIASCKVINGAIQSNTYEAFEYELEIIGGKIYIVINPTIFIDLKEHSKAKESYNKILSARYNRQFDSKLMLWKNALCDQTKQFGFSFGSISCLFQATPSYSDVKASKTIDYFQKIRILSEPKLFFHHTDKTYCSEHALKALNSFGPYELSLGSSYSSQHNLRISIICPKTEFGRAKSFFNELNRSSDPVSEKEYLIPYSSFPNIFRRGLEVPETTESPLFSDLSVNLGISIEEFYSELKRRIDQLSIRRSDFDLIAIYFPDHWNKFREKKNDQVYFDLHDSIKIYAAKKNVGIQFINDKSLKYFDRSKVKWWLSLALYAKSGAVPWVTDGPDSTVYVGLSHSINKLRQPKITIGMSQVFDSKGRGTRFLVSPVNKPVFIGKNPYMSKEDSRRLVHTLKETYFKMDSNAEIKKLVIHKVTPFIKDEIEGIFQATAGLDVELLHIQQYPAWRGIKGERGKGVAPYPVDRGTIIQLDEYSFLLFSHGCITNSTYLNSKKSYYQGARGIPAPLKVTRYAGKDSIDQIATEILRLTKMNWNGGELYKNLPVTIDFSRYLSKYSKQDELLLNTPYDFRYFI